MYYLHLAGNSHPAVSNTLQAVGSAITNVALGMDADTWQNQIPQGKPGGTQFTITELKNLTSFLKSTKSIFYQSYKQYSV